MNLPKRVKVGHMTFTVKVDNDKCLVLDSYGHTRGSTQEIVVRTGDGPDVQRDTLLHEVLHAAFYTSGLKVDDEVEERIVSALTGPLLTALRENPSLIRYLTTVGPSR